MRDAIAYMREHARAGTDAAMVAKAVGMSTSRFNHVFTQWVGIAPKRFLSHLTKGHAQELLKDSSVLKAAHRSGLSSPSRLHELMVVHDAVSPGEFKSGDIEIRYGIHPTPFGWSVVGLTKRGVCTLLFVPTNNERAAVAKIRGQWPKATLVHDPALTAPYAKKIFALSGKKQRIPIVMKGTNFQVQVWKALLAIPEGHAASYADIARQIGKPRAVRAVGSACGKNGICYLIPCHRVLTSNGGLGGYNGGVERKETILAWEAARAK